MSRRPALLPTDGELEILKVLWETGPAELGRICEILRRQRVVANTTVATRLKIMLDKGLVTRLRSGRGAQWQANLSQRSVGSSMLTRALDQVFDGSARRLVAHLLETQKLSTKDRRAILDMLESSRKKDKEATS